MLVYLLLFWGLWAGLVYASIAVGLVLVRQTCGFVNFAHGSVLAVAVYVSYWSLENVHSRWLALLAGTLAAMLFSVLAEEAVFRPLRSKGSSALTLMLASLGLYTVAINVLALVFGDQRIALAADSHALYSFCSAEISLSHIQGIVAISFLFLALLVFFQTGTGKRIRALASNPELAVLNGVQPRRVLLLVNLLSGATASCAGFFWASSNDFSPALAFRPFLYGMVAAVVGGFFGIRSALLGGLFVGLTEYLGVWLLPSLWQDVSAFIVLVVFLVMRPLGFMGRKERYVGRNIWNT